jgi:predicted amidohydrolase YtcJ
MRLALVVSIAVLVVASPAAAEPDIIIVGAKVFTADQRAPRAEAVAVEGSRISFVGTSAAARKLAGRNTRVIDAQGRW